MLNRVRPSIGMIGLKMENTHLQELTSTKLRLGSILRHGRW